MKLFPVNNDDNADWIFLIWTPLTIDIPKLHNFLHCIATWCQWCTQLASTIHLSVCVHYSVSKRSLVVRRGRESQSLILVAMLFDIKQLWTIFNNMQLLKKLGHELEKSSTTKSWDKNNTKECRNEKPHSIISFFWIMLLYDISNCCVDWFL